MAEDLIPGFGLVEKVGRGGLATVFKGEERATGNKVALKILHPQFKDDPVAVRRFEREGRMLCLLKHSNVVRGLKAGEANGVRYLILEWVPGVTLEALLAKEGVLSPRSALTVGMGILNALLYLKDLGVFHGDLKPGNLIVDEANRVKLIDLGFARKIGAPRAGDETELTFGTPEYMSPEQARGATDIDHRSDLYALGATLFHALIGRPPFKGASAQETLQLQVLAPIPREDLEARKLSPKMVEFIARLLAKEREARYQTPSAAVAVVRGLLGG